ncbi:MAG: hypothetical protein IJB91_07740 [Oscillospiraceae bacterium]|nr:hypothetical protein [Oscillospiraceae bacterium]
MEEIRPEEEIREQNIPQQEVQEQPVYTPRPGWQVWVARIGVGIVLIGFILYCLHIAGIGI